LRGRGICDHNSDVALDFITDANDNVAVGVMSDCGFGFLVAGGLISRGFGC